jgi:hypothetical protein
VRPATDAIFTVATDGGTFNLLGLQMWLKERFMVNNSMRKVAFVSKELRVQLSGETKKE